ncbi:MAG: helix-turn-helix transcriptional regulator [Oscillospiraceae bacterium]|nr:helix-turn-helix transcriptional regulator [Oscillospiraceae bacterium]
MEDIYENSSKGIVAANIKRLMRKKGVIASDVCRALEIPNATLSDWTNAKTYPRITHLEKLADYFGVNKAEITEIYIDREDPIYQIARAKTEEGKLLYLWRKADDIDKQTIWNILSRYDEVGASVRSSAG